MQYGDECFQNLIAYLIPSVEKIYREGILKFAKFKRTYVI